MVKEWERRFLSRVHSVLFPLVWLGVIAGSYLMSSSP